MSSHHARAFHDLHLGPPGRAFLLPNAWDAMSARAMAQAGAAAVGTTSAGVSWSRGRPDGEGLFRPEMVESIKRIVEAVGIPVTADIEGGYGRGTGDDVAETVREVIAVGAVGINLEDSPGAGSEPLLTIRTQADRIAAARAAAIAEGVDLFINARIDTWLLSVGEESERIPLTLERARAVVDAGADGVFVPGVGQRAVIRELASGIDAPLNIMGGPGSPSLSELAELGVRRVSVGPAIALLAAAFVGQVTGGLLNGSSFDSLRGPHSFADLNGWFDR